MQAGLNVLHREIVSLIPRLLSKSYQEVTLQLENSFVIVSHAFSF